MDIVKTDKMHRRWVAVIRGRRILSTRVDSKLCFGLPGINPAAQNNLPHPVAGGGSLQSREPVVKPVNKQPNMRLYGSKQ
jgi:hypothetical protein